MDMDLMTRREAAKVEDVLEDLVRELCILALLPDEFTSWVRDEAVVAATRSDTNRFLLRYEEHVTKMEKAMKKKKHNLLRDPLSGSGPHASAPSPPSSNGRSSSSSSSSSWADTDPQSDTTTSDPLISTTASLDPEVEQERQRGLKAACFVFAARHYGDPTDNDGNEAVLQVSDYALLERDLLAAATTTGSVNATDLQTHHLSTRALIDTLRDGGYSDIATYFLKSLHAQGTSPIPGSEQPSSSTEMSDLTTLLPAYKYGMLDEGMDHLRRLVMTLRRLIHQRNQSTVNEDIHRYQLLHDAVNRDQAGTADVQVLNQRYLEVKAARKQEVSALDREIEALEKELWYAQRTADVELEAFQKMQKSLQESRRFSLRQQLEAHRKNADEMASQLKKVQAKAQDELNTLRSNRTKREAAVSGAITEYDAQSALLEAAMRQFNKETEEDTERIVALEETVEKLLKEREEHAWEIKVSEQRQEHAQVIHERHVQNARVIQAYYRAYIVRVQVERDIEKSSRKRKKKHSAKK
ncbi:hypothetical protein JKF63_05351 [Porcisia hertigi]|uniref:Dynein regulatory complex protein 10 n=1 Tax=Porcisia hertigi TaxID=2761500 RepID=A0A836ITE9_9TRYP|nr:hypothetical protein JKF63_05351 [Porcisia hertigi]